MPEMRRTQNYCFQVRISLNLYQIFLNQVIVTSLKYTKLIFIRILKNLNKATIVEYKEVT